MSRPTEWHKCLWEPCMIMLPPSEEYAFCGERCGDRWRKEHEVSLKHINRIGVARTWRDALYGRGGLGRK